MNKSRLKTLGIRQDPRTLSPLLAKNYIYPSVIIEQRRMSRNEKIQRCGGLYEQLLTADDGRFSVLSEFLTDHSRHHLRYFWRLAIVGGKFAGRFELMAKSASKKHEDTTGPALLRSARTSSVDLPHLCTFS
ncbi:hypothetical protein HN011_001838, partial [Eciton burchellii]